MKRTMILGTLLLSAFTMQACVKEIVTTTVFDPEEVSYILDEGSNTISGQAFLRQRGGGVITCAGNTVHLVPAGTYARERIQNIYGTIFRPALSLAYARADSPDPYYVTLSREARCDAQGNFLFQGVADGAYFVATKVVWEVNYQLQGGHVMAPVKVSGGQAVEVIVSP